MNKMMLFFLISCLPFFLCQCTNPKETAGDTPRDTLKVTEDAKEKTVDELWEEARQYQATITDTTFLQTKTPMSASAIEPFEGENWNKNFPFNQVVYVAALERAKKHLTVKENRLVCTLTSGAEIKVAEDLFQYIILLFDSWNQEIEKGTFRIVPIEGGGYDIEPAPRR